jgi:hypothetical protein
MGDGTLRSIRMVSLSSDGLLIREQRFSGWYMAIFFAAMNTGNLVIGANRAEHGFDDQELFDMLRAVMSIPTVEFTGEPIPISPIMFDSAAHYPDMLQNVIMGATGLGPQVLRFLEALVSAIPALYFCCHPLAQHSISRGSFPAAFKSSPY